ncbi:L-fuculose phosphate aldolase [Salmonella enterica subsp. enterica serovar Senftenberg str. A4-543]|uniref:L-fuculose phosphate aldolase n=7 Tax=Enterobacteriaceae TaxID=543 RepID=G5R4W8_SALSE|nr:L-fuculose phosphate aldolase [Salmonella enterica subsp. enterica serovar Senftenberg str. A4-543]
MERNRLARQIIDTCLEMTRLGLNQGTAGNVSVRYQGGLLITPTGIHFRKASPSPPTGIPYEKLTESHIVFIDADGQHEQGKLPSSEWRFHMAAYQTRPDANAVVHNHAVHCTAVSILNRPIPAIHYMIAAAGGNSIPCAPYATFGTRELSDHVAVALKNRKATLLQHHGLIACEENLDKALWLAHEVEVLAQLYLSTLAIVDPVPVLDDEAIAIVLEKFKTYGLRIEE